MTAKEIFDITVKKVADSYKNEDTDLSYLLQDGFGFEDLNVGVKFGSRVPNELYTLIGEDGDVVEVHSYAYDPTKTFSPVQPDINKLYVRLKDKAGKQLDEYSSSFSDKR